MRATRLLTTTLLALGLATTSGAGATAAPPDDTVPVVTINSVQWQKVFPADDGYRDSTRISYVVADAVDPTVDVRVVVTDSADTVLGERVETGVPTGSEALLRWDGSDFLGTSLVAGDYTLTFTATDASGNTSPSVARTLTVDEGRLVDRTARGWIKAKPSVIAKDVRRCSTLKSPVRGWSGSLGYYANTRCATTGLPSVVSTVHGVYVPKAFKDRDRGWFYGSMKVTTWGGNSAKRRGSKAVLQYWKGSQESWTKSKTMGSRLGAHAGRKTSAKPFVVVDDGRPAIIWGLLTANGHWYDVKKFGLTLHYKQMVYPTATREVPFTLDPATGVSITAPTLP